MNGNGHHQARQSGNDSSEVYYVRPDKNTSIVAVVGLAVFAWLASQWAEGVSKDSEEALRKAESAVQVNERQSQQLDRMPDILDQSVTNAIAPVKMRLDDLSQQYSNVYSQSSAERDKAVNTQEIMSIKAEVNANQNAIQTVGGRVDGLENSLDDQDRKLEQIYQAVLGRNNGSRDTATSVNSGNSRGGS